MTNLVNTNQVVTMTSLELVDFINRQRSESESTLRHDDFLRKVPLVLGEKDARKFAGIYQDSMNRKKPCYTFPKREACLMAMSYSYDLQAKVFDRMTELERTSVTAIPEPSDKLLEVVNRTLQQNEKLIEALVRLSNPAPEPQRVQFNPPCLVGVKAEVRREVLLDTLRAGPVVTDAYAQATGLTRNRVMSDVHDLRVRGIPVRTEYGLEGTTYIME